MNRAVAVLTCLVAAWCVPPMFPLRAAQAVYYEIDDLGDLGGPSAFPMDVNDAGDVVGQAPTAGLAFHAFLFARESGLQDLDTFGGASSGAFGINAAGQIVGSVNRPDGTVWAMLYSPATGAIDLGTLGGRAAAVARGINDAGYVVGYSRMPGDSLFHAFRWHASSGMEDLGTFGGAQSAAYRVNNNGQVVGYAELPGGSIPRYHAFRYTEGISLQDLGTPSGTTSAISQGRGINASGDVVGYWAPTGNSATRAFLFTDGRGIQDLGTLGGSFSTANDINDGGQIIGVSSDGTGQHHPFVHTPSSGMVDLNSLIDPAAGWVLSNADAVNNRGTIVGTGRFAGRLRAFRARRVRDDSGPEIDATLSPGAGPSGWHNGPVTVRWSVRDAESGIGSSSGCEPVVLTSDTAGTTLTCAATNALGGSASRSLTVRIDRTPPTLTCSASPSVIWPPTGEMVGVQVALNATDPASGVVGFVLRGIRVNGAEPPSGTVAGFVAGSASTSGFVRAERSGATRGRTYGLTYGATDVAGNTAMCTATVTVPHSSSQSK